MPCLHVHRRSRSAYLGRAYAWPLVCAVGLKLLLLLLLLVVAVLLVRLVRLLLHTAVLGSLPLIVSLSLQLQPYAHCTLTELATIHW